MPLKTLDLAEIFSNDANRIVNARREAALIHGAGDIRAAGNAVENAVRDYLKRMLPPRFHVTGGHLIDRAGKVSPQIDIIISDNMNLASFLTTNDGTEFVPITSVLAIGEVKSTYRHSDNPYGKFCDVLRDIHNEMHRPLIENTAYEGIKAETTFYDMILPQGNKYRNYLYSFVFFVNSGDFKFAGIAPVLNTENPQYLPSMAVLLDKVVIAYAKTEFVPILSINFSAYPTEVTDPNYDWHYLPAPRDADPQKAPGIHLATWYGMLGNHLGRSITGDLKTMDYVQDFVGLSKTLVQSASDHHTEQRKEAP